MPRGDSCAGSCAQRIREGGRLHLQRARSARFSSGGPGGLTYLAVRPEHEEPAGWGRGGPWRDSGRPLVSVASTFASAPNVRRSARRKASRPAQRTALRSTTTRKGRAVTCPTLRDASTYFAVRYFDDDPERLIAVVISHRLDQARSDYAEHAHAEEHQTGGPDRQIRPWQGGGRTRVVDHYRVDGEQDHSSDCGRRCRGDGKGASHRPPRAGSPTVQRRIRPGARKPTAWRR